jgi:hypothetical protein
MVLLRCLAFVALVSGVARSGRAQTRGGTADITIEVASSNTAHVEGRYVLASPPPGVELRALTRPCATIENLRVEPASGLVQSHSGPWMTWRDTTPPYSTDSLHLIVRYDVRLRETGAVPIVYVALAVGAVSVTVRFDDHSRRVMFPQMTRKAPGEWSARYVSAPSFVEVAGVRKAQCEEDEAGQGDNGGLVWRFFLLVGIMAAWVPLYLAWARRTGDSV